MPAENTETRKLTAIMFTDMLGYSAVSQRDESLALELLAEQQQLLRAQFPLFNGREVKSTGDGFLVEFPSALQATQCAVAIQRALMARNQSQPSERRFQVRIGLHVGDVVHRGNDIYGDGVNIAARIEPLATGGGICVSDTIYSQIRNKLEFALTKLDSPRLKHIEVPMDVYRVILPWEQTSVDSQAGKPVANVRLVLVAGILLLAAAGGWWLTHRETTPPVPPRPNHPDSPSTAAAATPPTTTNHPSQKSVAVLPFVNMTGDTADDYLSDGMTEELLNALAKAPGLRVPGRSSSFAFKGKSGEDIFQKVGAQLHVTTVLEGSVRKAGDKLRITAQLINVADGFHLWSETYDGDIKDILSVQSDVAQRVMQALEVKLGVEAAYALAKKSTENPEAHRLYLRGRYRFAKGTFQDFDEAIKIFQRAIQLDPNYALAYCGLADTYGFIGGVTMSGKEAFNREKELGRKALDLDANLAEAHFSIGLGLASTWHWREGEMEMKRAIEMNPNMAVAFDQYAFLLTCQGRHDEAIAMSKRAVELEPLSPLVAGDMAVWLRLARRYDEAIAQGAKAFELDSNLPIVHWTTAWSRFWQGDKSILRA